MSIEKLAGISREDVSCLQEEPTDGSPCMEHYSRADLLVHGLLEVVVVDDGADLAVAVGGPIRRRHLCPGFAGVHAVPLLLVNARESSLPLLPEG